MMVRRMCRTSLQDGTRNKDLHEYMSLSGIAEEKMYDKPRLYWLVARRDESHWLRTPRKATWWQTSQIQERDTGRRHVRGPNIKSETCIQRKTFITQLWTLLRHSKSKMTRWALPTRKRWLQALYMLITALVIRIRYGLRPYIPAIIITGHHCPCYYICICTTLLAQYENKKASIRCTSTH